jgi:hypothetical protein
MSTNRDVQRGRRPRLLYVDPYPAGARAVARALNGMEVELCASLDAARRRCSMRGMVAVLARDRIGTRTGWSLLASISHPKAIVGRGVMPGAEALRCHGLEVPFLGSELRRLVHELVGHQAMRASDHRLHGGRRVAPELEDVLLVALEVGRDFGLREAEVHSIVLSTMSDDRDELAARLQVNAHTLQSYASRVRRLTGRSIESWAKAVLREVYLRDRRESVPESGAYPSPTNLTFESSSSRGTLAR